MGLIEDEVNEVSRLCCNVIPNSKLVTCMTSLIRVDIQHTDSRQLTACLRFPVDYPGNKLLMEFKSKTMSLVFLERFTKICDEKAAEFVGKPQVMNVLKFVDCYLRENPLCIVTEEIFNLKRLLGGSDGGELKIRQKTSSVGLTAKGGSFFFSAKFHVPEEYPVKRIHWEDHSCNLPQALILFVNGQAGEIARQCVEAPLRQQSKTDHAFVPKPSLERTLRFVIEAMKGFPDEKCPICGELSLPTDAKNVVLSDDQDQFVIRMFCGHIYHQGCLKRFMSEPPFPPGGKICPAKRRHPRSDGNSGKAVVVDDARLCQQRVTHDKWGLNNVKSAEAKWAHQQARIRELEEVIDFFK